MRVASRRRFAATWIGIAAVVLIATHALADDETVESVQPAVQSTTLRIMLLPEVYAHLSTSDEYDSAWPHVPEGAAGKIATPLHGVGIADVTNRPSGASAGLSSSAVHVRVGETVLVELDAFGAHGHEWFFVAAASTDVHGPVGSVKSGDEGVLTGPSERGWAPTAAEPRGSGAPGLRDGHDTFNFTAVRAGNALVSFQYARPPGLTGGPPTDPIMTAVVEVACAEAQQRNASSDAARTVRVVHPRGGVMGHRNSNSGAEPRALPRPGGAGEAGATVLAVPAASGYLSGAAKASVEVGGNVRVMLEALEAESLPEEGWVYAGSSSVDLGPLASVRTERAGVLAGGKSRVFVANKDAEPPAAPRGVGFSVFSFTAVRPGNAIASFELRPDGGRPAQTAMVEIECVGSAGDDSESGEEL